MPASPLDILRSTFGFASFRGVQDRVIGRTMAGQHTLAVMPTGAGKSLCYQVPAMAREGTALVISPLIALMHDQIRAADAFGIKAACLTSADNNRAETVERLRSGDLDLLYVAPERGTTGGFRDLLARVPLALIAIDEAHCVSEWGHDFRPDYRLLRPLLDSFADVPRLALTATADQRTREDILVQLGIPADGLIVAGFDRPNIRYHVRPRDSAPKQLAALLEDQPGPGIVYVQSRDKAQSLADQLGKNGRPVLPYHAGLEPQIRARNQAAFVASEDMVMVATIAFGMGIDKPDVCFVAHAGIPKSIEAYYQETGRAGRDGDPAEAWLFWGATDFSLARRRIGEVEPARQAGERERLNALAALVEAASCRRAVLLRHFGEAPPERCGNCDNCLTPPSAVDATLVAQKLLSAAFRTEMRFGIGHLTDVLAGKETDKVHSFGHHRLSVFGIANADELALLRPVSRALMARDALRADDFGGLSFGPNAKPILKGETKLEIVLPARRSGRKARGRGRADEAESPLFAALRAKRREIASAAAVPPYVIFHDSTLREMAALRPGSLAAMAEVPGVGSAKLERYGQAFLQVIREADHAPA